ncbi:MAG: NupC/NupG family nucleoside CNT transporter [Acidimicrobiia bacterium]|nr:NupC/NupG family nucleoside CNT transporter [Acidimicrobiia bacterium]
MERLGGLAGFFLLLGIACVLSTAPKSIRWKTVGWGIILQFLCALVVLKGRWLAQAFDWLPLAPKHFFWIIAGQLVPLRLLTKRLTAIDPRLPRRLLAVVAIEFFLGALKFNLVARFFAFMREVVNRLIAYSSDGATFVFGALGSEKGEKSLGFVFAFQVLPTIIFVASIFAILYYLGLMQAVVKNVSRVMSRFMGSSGAESVSVAASIFMGQTEAPLTIRPFLAEMTRSELMTVMTAGMAHVSGGIMAAYVLVAHVDVVHLLTAVVMTAPGAIMVAKIMVPETETPKTSGDLEVVIPRTDVNLVDAAARGASEGMHLALNVAAMLIAFIALVSLANGLLGVLHRGLTSPPYSRFLGVAAQYWPENLQQILGVVFRPVAWSMGVSWKDSFEVGNLLGTRLVLNEFVSFLRLGQVGSALDPSSFTIATFALCGFANFGSIAIQVGGIGALAPTRRHDLASLGIRAMIAGTIANFLSASIAGMIL